MKQSNVKILGIDRSCQSVTEPLELITTPSMYLFIGSSIENELLIKLCNLAKERLEKESGKPISEEQWLEIIKNDEFLRLIHFMIDAYKLGNYEATI